MRIALNPFQSIMQSQYRNRLKRELNDKERLESVYSSRFWNSPNEDKLRQFCNTAAMMLDAPIAHITLVTDKVQRIVAGNDGYEEPSYPYDESLPDFSICQHVVGLEDAVPIGDTEATPDVCHVSIVEDGGVKAYLGVPLVGRDGAILGAFCVMDFKQRDWTDIDVTALTQLASALVNMHEVGVLS